MKLHKRFFLWRIHLYRLRSNKRLWRKCVLMLRLGFAAILCILFASLRDAQFSHETGPIQFYFSICEKNLHQVFLKAIQSANQSIDIFAYTINDERLLHELIRVANQGIQVSISSHGSQNLALLHNCNHIQQQPLEMKSGLMHQKILVVDKAKVWIGSANFTTSSLYNHDNFVMLLESPQLAKASCLQQIHQLAKTSYSYQLGPQVMLGAQKVELLFLPEQKQEALKRLVQLIDSAKHSLKIAMYTWTNQVLTDAVIRAYHRGVQVDVILDRNQANGVGKKTAEQLRHASHSLSVKGTADRLLHHKCILIDHSIVVNGSANWTAAAFARNRESFVILYDITAKQLQQYRLMWERTFRLSEEFVGSLSHKKPSLFIAFLQSLRANRVS